jgi:hypothetical protein
MDNRPSKHEICKKVAEALASLRAGKPMVVVSRHIYSDLAALGVDTEEFPPLLIKLLEEIQSADPVKCYVGRHPPLLSDDPALHNHELFPYSWHSPSLNKLMYLKFAIKKECYIHVDCHESRPPKKRV